MLRFFDRQRSSGLWAAAVAPAPASDTDPARSSTLDPQVGLDHGRVLLHRFRPPFRDETPVVEHVHLVGDAHDQTRCRARREER